MNIFCILFCVLLMIVYQVIFYLSCKKFRVNKKFLYFFGIIFPLIIMFLKNNYSYEAITLSLSYNILISLSIIDIKHREIDGKSYIFILIPAVLFFLLGTFNHGGIYYIISVLGSLFSTAFLMFIYFIIGNRFGNEIGGADVKIFIILSLFYSFSYIFTFIFYSLIFALVLGILYTIKEKKKNVSIPMIVPITIGHILISSRFLI